MLTKRSVATSPSTVCFSCNQSFEGNPVGVQFDTDLISPAAASELRGLTFHPGHLYHYARRREWTPLVQFLAHEGPAKY